MPTRPEAEIAKNYLTQDEIKSLNRIVSLYLDFAEMQAEEHRPMYMKDWINILDDFLRISRKDILTHAGRISAKFAKEKADTEYDKFKERTKNERQKWQTAQFISQTTHRVSPTACFFNVCW